ncbi:MAG: DUF1667 domain-containing protein [Oscillospiraceae bacterium]|nr:DUF1667 domain-containing protein [Oscillospiraceae bacterium]
MKELVCIVCPAGCRITVGDDGKISGYTCERGLHYAQNETTCPKRVVTSTVKAVGGLHRRLPVRTNGEIPKTDMLAAVRALNALTVRAPVRAGEVVLADVLGTGVDFIASRDL